MTYDLQLQFGGERERRDDACTGKGMVREVEDEKSKWGIKLKEEWKALGVETVRGWCNKVKDEDWLASKLGRGRKKKKEKKKT